ncbi:hypothetical protein [Diaphorobacter ruginosibacter]|uniref:hypothetical protein n=1 Tax=Diaphorobacter ruginosibacter TaxID=1715720 RepID=UPI00333E70C1
MTQSLIVALIIAVAALYLLWRYMPQKWRNPLGRINPKLAQVSGCGSGCSSCSSDGDKAGGACSSGGANPDAPDSRPLVFHRNVDSGKS